MSARGMSARAFGAQSFHAFGGEPEIDSPDFRPTPAKHRVEVVPASFRVTSGDSGAVYTVTPTGPDSATCSCPAGEHGRPCKHVAAVREWARGEFARIRTEMSACDCPIPVECPACAARERVLRAMEGR